MWLKEVGGAYGERGRGLRDGTSVLLRVGKQHSCPVQLHRQSKELE